MYEDVRECVERREGMFRDWKEYGWYEGMREGVRNRVGW